MDSIMLVSSKHGTGSMRLNTGHGWWTEEFKSPGSFVSIAVPHAEAGVERTDKHTNFGITIKPCQLETRLHIPRERISSAFEGMSTAVYREDWVHVLMNEMWQQGYQSSESLSNIFCDSASLAIFAHFLRKELKDCREEKRGGIAPRRKKMVIEYIYSNIASKISVEEISSLCGLSEYHFIRVFRAEFGITPYQYILKMRIKKAIELLSSCPKANIHDIAILSGFSSASALNVQFRRITGVSPQLYRRRTL